MITSPPMINTVVMLNEGDQTKNGSRMNIVQNRAASGVETAETTVGYTDPSPCLVSRNWNSRLRQLPRMYIHEEMTTYSQPGSTLK